MTGGLGEIVSGAEGNVAFVFIPAEDAAPACAGEVDLRITAIVAQGEDLASFRKRDGVVAVGEAGVSVLLHSRDPCFERDSGAAVVPLWVAGDVNHVRHAGMCSTWVAMWRMGSYETSALMLPEAAFDRDAPTRI